MASTFEGWMTAASFSILFIILFGTIVVQMNDLHSGDYEIEGLETDGIKNQLEEYTKSAEDRIQGGDASFVSAVGLTLSTSWNVITSLFSMVMFFVGGGWIQTVSKYMMFPDIVGWIFRTLYIAALSFIVLRVLFKVKV